MFIHPYTDKPILSGSEFSKILITTDHYQSLLKQNVTSTCYTQGQVNYSRVHFSAVQKVTMLETIKTQELQGGSKSVCFNEEQRLLTT